MTVMAIPMSLWDPAYPISPYLLSPYNGLLLRMTKKNSIKPLVYSSRETVEWSFAKVVRLWSFLDFKKNFKMYKQPVGKYYLVATILTNCHTCMNGSQAEIILIVNHQVYKLICMQLNKKGIDHAI
jgi:hypothetical protein